MAFISSRVNKNAKKCFDCVFQQIQSKIQGKINKTTDDFYFDKDGLWYKGTKIAFESVMRAGCSFCPTKEDFVKVYGVDPFEYFRDEFMKKIKEESRD